MVFVFFLLSGVILTYWVLTDAHRVREMAEDYLSKLTGGQVEVKGATLSIFEGLRLDGVTVQVDDSRRPDSTVFKAQTILIKYNPQSILSGRLEATQIVALDPQVFLCEDIDRGRWNWQRATREERATTQGVPGPRMKFPEILLRNAQLSYSRIRDGKLLVERGLMEIEGSLTPGDDGAFTFKVQSRGEADSKGPVVEGHFNVDSKMVEASLRDFSFGKDIEVMLPEQVRRWWNDHGLSGSLDIPRFYMKPGKRNEKSRFRIETNLKEVTLDIRPEEWLSRDEVNRLAAMRGAVSAMRGLGLDTNGFVSGVEGLFNPSTIELDRVAGRFVFTEDGIDVEHVSGRVEDTPFQIKGHIDGYSPQAAASITVEGKNVTIPHTPRYLNAMPPDFRELYDHLRPEGDGALWVQIDRPSLGAKPTVMGRIDIVDGRIRFDEFPYPLERIKGAIRFGWDPQLRMDTVDVEMHGMGASDGPNKAVPVTVKGWVGPLGHGDSEFNFWVMTDGVTSEPALTNAYPPPVREALKIFDAAGKGELPKYHGGFVAHVHRPYGYRQRWSIGVDVDLDDAQGRLSVFPYPVEHLKAMLHITEDHVDIFRAGVVKGDADFDVNGVVRFGKDRPIDPRLRLTAHNIPIDRDLLAALPPDRREWLTRIGAAGKIDVDGQIVRAAGAPTTGGKTGPDDISYTMDIKLKEGSFRPAEGALAASGVTGAMRLTPTSLDVADMRGKRGRAELSGSGQIAWPPGHHTIAIAAAARNLQLDAGLYKLLPAPWRAGWDQAKPEGSVDIDLSYRGGYDEKTTGAPVVAAAPPAPTTAPTDGFRASIRPVKLAMTPRVVPCRLENVKGELVIHPDQITLKEITATRKSGGTVAYSGTVPTGDNNKNAAWDLKLSAKDLATDSELRTALPPAVAKLLESLKAQGKLSADFTKLIYRAPPDAATADGELDLAGTLTLKGNSFDLGVPVTDVSGTITLDAGARHGSLATLTGGMDLSSLTLGGRTITNFKCDLLKPEGADALRIGRISGDIAGGALAGQVDLLFPDKGPSRFGLGMVLRNANVSELAGPSDKDIKGQLTASLAIEGNWGDPASRRGRGDVAVNGKDMYRIPLVLGLLQVTNLTLPISSPFNEAAARYTVEGEKISFDQIELRASNMLMSGSGWLDFASKKVKMTFVTDNPNAWRIPFISDILRGARQEFMQIHVTGSVQEPKVSGAMMNTFTTTVDEVFDKNGGKKNGK